MTKKKPKTTKITTEPAPEQTPPELSPAQIYEKQLQQVVADFPEMALELLAAKILAIEAPESAREMRPWTSDPALGRLLRPIGEHAVRGWVVRPSAPRPAEFPPRTEPSEESIERAASRRRIEESHTYEVDMRRIMNEDRERAGLPPL